MFAKMTIQVGAHQVLTIPKEAVQDTDKDKVVYVPVSNTSFREQKVELGSESGPYYEVLKGLHPGETVVTKGSFDLRSEALKELE
jgi:Membrane-fusion protein